MSFVNRVKDILLKKNAEELANLNERIREVEKAHSRETESVQKLKEESEIASKEKSEVQKTMISRKELEELEVIYEFIANYPQIEQITEKIRNAAQMTAYISNSDGYVENEEVAYIEEMNYRNNLCGIVKGLNEGINEILNGENEEQEKQEDNAFKQDENSKNEMASQEDKEMKKVGFFSKLFGRAKKTEEPKRESSILKKVKNPFNQYRRTIQDFKDLYSGFLVVNLDGPTVVDRIICMRLITNINNLVGAKKRGFELEQDDEEYLEFIEPHELWREISKYYSSTVAISTIIQNFESNVGKYEKLYKERPGLFDVKNLERIFEENNQVVVNLKSKNKVALSKSSEVAKKRQEEKEIRGQLKALEDKRKAIKERNEKIRAAKTLKEMGYRNKEDAARKLSIETKDYIIIPVPSDIRDISELFNEEKRLKVEVDGKTFYTTYSNETATGKINSVEDSKNINAVLMVPISELTKDDIDNIKSGKVSVSKSVLQHKKLMAIMAEGRDLNFGDANVNVRKYSYGTIGKQVKEFLGDDYVVNSDETENYDVFKGIPNVSSREKRLKKDAVKKCVLENVGRNVGSTDTIYVNGKSFFINKEDETDIMQGSKLQPLNESELYQISDEIEEFLIEDGKSSLKIDLMYKKLLMEYMRVNRKAKADYYAEDNTSVMLNGKEMSIKPILPAKDETIAKRYSRRREDVVYKTMKLAALVNKFAHLTENEQLQISLFEVKRDLIENAIDLSQDNPNINLKREFDKQKMLMSVRLEIPGYNMIALHLMNKSNSLSYKANRLEEAQGEVLQSSAILIPGVNKELLMAMKNMKEEERGQFLIDMNPTTFYKLALRMGYTSEGMSSDDDRKKFIKKMISDRKIEELLKENDELEK